MISCYIVLMVRCMIVCAVKNVPLDLASMSVCDAPESSSALTNAVLTLHPVSIESADADLRCSLLRIMGLI